MALSLTMRIGEILMIGDHTAIKLVDRSGRSARFAIESHEKPIQVRQGGQMVISNSPKPAKVDELVPLAFEPAAYGIVRPQRTEKDPPN